MMVVFVVVQVKAPPSMAQPSKPLNGPNVPLPTLGGRQIWADVFIYAGWRIQENVFTGHFRLLDNRDVRRAWGDKEACQKAFEEFRKEKNLHQPHPDAVIFLHGIARSKETFGKMARAAEASGYTVIDVNYPSTRRPLKDHADQLSTIIESLEDINSVSFVTHSMGGIVLRAYFQHHRQWPKGLSLKRAVMLAPPNSGSNLAAQIASLPFDLVYGESGQELATSDLSDLPSPPMSFAVIAGGLNDGEGYNPLLEGDDDGIVTVTEAHLDGVEAFLVIDQIHSFLPTDKRAVAATMEFLETGKIKATITP
jgi:pimeloyl-ACP methyl ester carboxylesterase